MSDSPKFAENQLQIGVESEEATVQLGRQIAESLESGAIVALVGDLGAGKTRLVQAIAVGLGVPVDQVNSPTFTLVQVCRTDSAQALRYLSPSKS